MLLIQPSFTNICFPIPSATLEISAFPPVLRPRFPVKVTGTKSGKKVSKNLAANITVKSPAARIKIDGKTVKRPVVEVGSKTILTGVSAPKSSPITFKSSDETIATVDADGTLTALKAGTVNIAARNALDAKYVINVTVKDAVAELSAVTQTASNAFTATFTSDASKTITKDDFKVAAADGSVELAVNSVEYSADGLSAKVTLFGNFTNAKEYKITCKDKILDLTAKVGAVARVAINTASAELNTETPISFTLFDADGIDVTPSVSVDSTCMVTATGSYSAFKNDKASASTITMNEVGKTVEVTVTYNTNEIGAQDITAKQTITCVRANAIQGNKLFAATSNINKKSGCAKFYLGLSNEIISLEVGETNDNVYFCVKDSKGDVINYDKYEVESSNDDVASVSVSKESGKYAQISVRGNTVGNVSLNIKASKNGEPAYYTMPVTVKQKSSAVRMTVTADRLSMSNSNDNEYQGTIIAKLYDKDGRERAGHFVYEVSKNKDSENFKADALNNDGSLGYYTAKNAKEGTYAIKITGADNENETVTFVKTVNIRVSDLPKADENGCLNLTYQIELRDEKGMLLDKPIDEVKGSGNNKVKARLYATCNNLFVGYVRKGTNGENGIIIGNDGNIKPATTVTKVTVGVRFGTNYYNCDDTVTSGGGLYAPVIKDYKYDELDETLASRVYSTVTSGTSIVCDPNRGSGDLAKTGNYTIEYRIYTDANKYDTITRTFTVTSGVQMPVVTVLSRTVDSLTYGDIRNVLKTDVDMNNNNGLSSSVVGFTDSVDHEMVMNTVNSSNRLSCKETNGKITVRYAIVEDNYGDATYYFCVPINATFKTE